jgi:hypothetical protein
MADETLKGLEVAILVKDGHKQGQRAGGRKSSYEDGAYACQLVIFKTAHRERLMAPLAYFPSSVSRSPRRGGIRRNSCNLPFTIEMKT